MTQEEKQLLLKDLCARLLYGVILNIDYYDLQGDGKLENRDVVLSCGNIGYCFQKSNWTDFKPYLRPMSSMTEEEKEEFNSFNGTDGCYIKTMDFCHKKHLDNRGLIRMGLALEAPEDMYESKSN